MKKLEKIREHLRSLEVSGILTPDNVVADARRPESPIHSYFTWDVQKAAEEHWLDQARTLIRNVTVNVTVQNVVLRTPFYIPDPTKPDNAQGYTNLDVLRQNPNSAKQSLLAECERAAGVLRRARLIAASLNLDDQVDNLLANIAGLQQAIERDGPTPIQ